MNTKNTKLIKQCRCGQCPKLIVNNRWAGYLVFAKIHCPSHRYYQVGDMGNYGDHFDPIVMMEDHYLSKSIILQTLSKWNSREN